MANVIELVTISVRLVYLDIEVRSEELLVPAYNRTFPCMEATYPLCHKEPARSKHE